MASTPQDRSSAHPFGIDFGGSGIKGAPVDLSTGEFAAERTRVETPARRQAARRRQGRRRAGGAGRSGRLAGRHHGAGRRGAGRREVGGEHRRVVVGHRRGDDVRRPPAPGRHRGQRRRRGRAGRGALRRGARRVRPGGRDHPGHRHRHGTGLRRRAGPELRARAHRDRRPGRRVGHRQQRPGEEGPVAGRSGPSCSPTTTGRSRGCSPPTCSSWVVASASTPTSTSRSWRSRPRIVPAQLRNTAGIVGAAVLAAEAH